MPDRAGVTIVVALIGAAGVLGAAYLSHQPQIAPLGSPPQMNDGRTLVQEPPPDPNSKPKPVVMGGRLDGFNLPGQDFDDRGTPASNAPQCFEQCRTNEQCDAATYVISLKTCWMKSGVPQPVQGGADYVSSIKRQAAG